MTGRAIVLPTPRALLEPVSEVDPVADLRAACLAAVEGVDEAVVVHAPLSPLSARQGVTEALGWRVARSLLPGAALHPDGSPPAEDAEVVLVMADGSAARHEKAPGHLHPAAEAFDATIDAALRAGDAAALRTLDPALGAEVWSEGVPALLRLGGLAADRQVRAQVTWSGAPHGVAWWVARWDL